MARFVPSEPQHYAPQVYAGPQYDAYKKSPSDWWIGAPARVFLSGGFGAVGFGITGYILGALIPAVSAKQGAKVGAIIGGATGALRALIPPSPDK